jgi:hypothetical protein
MFTENMTPAEILLEEARAELTSTHGRLLSHALTVSERMARFGERLQTEGIKRNVNELGELQSYATDLDRLCAVFAEKQRFVRTLERLVSAGEKARS